MKLLKDQRGIAPIAIILIVLVLGGAGFAAYRVAKNEDSKSNTNQSVTNKDAEKECNEHFNDMNFCKFASRFNAEAAYKTTFNSTDKDGKTSAITMESDGKQNSSMVTKEGDRETSAFIYLSGDTYIKDVSDGSWIKYPKNPDTPAIEDPTDNLGVDFKEEKSKPENERTQIKNLGKEECGDFNCFKYQIIDPTEPAGTETFIWFDDKDYQLRKWSFKDEDGTQSVGEFEYKSVNIVAPSPVKEATTPSGAPSQEELQRALEQAQQYAQ